MHAATAKMCFRLTVTTVVQTAQSRLLQQCLTPAKRAGSGQITPCTNANLARRFTLPHTAHPSSSSSVCSLLSTTFKLSSRSLRNLDPRSSICMYVRIHDSNVCMHRHVYLSVSCCTIYKPGPHLQRIISTWQPVKAQSCCLPLATVRRIEATRGRSMQIETLRHGAKVSWSYAGQHTPLHMKHLAIQRVIA